MSQADVETIVRLLRSEYGRQESHPGGDPLSVLVLTILSQNTSDTNSGRAFANLKGTFQDWDELAVSDVDKIAEAIRAGGLGKIKARRIKQALNEIKQKRGELELDFLEKMPLAEAKEWLMQLPGVGNKTASVVLLFSLGRPALPVDTHVFRVSKRLGLIQARATLDEAHRVLGKLVPPEAVFEFHVLMIEHGRRTCTARRPHCLQCALKKLCPSFEKFMGYKAE